MTRKLWNTNTSGTTGVSFNKSTGRWTVKVSIDGVQQYLSTHATKEQAVAARLAAQPMERLL